MAGDQDIVILKDRVISRNMTQCDVFEYREVWAVKLHILLKRNKILMFELNHTQKM